MAASPTGTGIHPDLRKLYNLQSKDPCSHCLPYLGNRYTQRKVAHWPHPGMFPMRVMPGDEFEPEFSQRVFEKTPFSLNELKEIKKDLGCYTDNPDHYV
jgi:hypothetical protein